MITLGKGKPVITPDKWVGGKEECIKTKYDAVVMTFWDSPIELLENTLRNPREVRLRGVPVMRAVEGNAEDLKVLATRLYFGAPAAVTALELLVAMGMKKFLVYGGAGSITPKLKIGDILVPTWGVREEGTSYHYMPEDYVPKPSPALTSKLRNALFSTLSLQGLKVMEGGVWSTDAIFRETEDKIREYAKKGVLGTDMESTALMTVAEYRGVELAVALLITDELHTLEWRTPSEDEWRKLEDNEKLILNALLSALR